MANTAGKDRLTMTVTEAAAALGIGRNQAYEAVHRGDIPSVKIGGRFLVPVKALNAMLEGAPRAA